MFKYSLLLLCIIGCASNPVSEPITETKTSLVPNPPPSAKNPCTYQGYAILSQFNEATHKFERIGKDSVAAQIRVMRADDEIHATVSIDGESRPYDVFLFANKGYYFGNDSISYAYISSDYSSIVWGCQSPGNVNQYKTVYASQ